MQKINSLIIQGWGMLSLTGIFLFTVTYFFSCHGKKQTIETPKPVFVEEHRQKLENFVFIVKEAHEECIESEESSCLESDINIFPIASASGVVLSSSSSHIFILTANHFCQDSDVEKIFGDLKIRGFIGETTRQLSVVTYSESSDICLLQGLRNKGENFKTTRIAKEMPLIGSHLYNVAAPDGMASPHTRLMFTGKFSGCEVLNCVYTIPATFGSSGSAIYNEKGELVSLLVAAAVNFGNVSMGPHVEAINVFIDTVQENVDIY